MFFGAYSPSFSLSFYSEKGKVCFCCILKDMLKVGSFESFDKLALLKSDEIFIIDNLYKSYSVSSKLVSIRLL